jgi:hypothetical protein
VYNCIEGVCRASDIEIIELFLGNKKPWSKIQRQPYTQTTTSRELSVTSDGLVREGFRFCLLFVAIERHDHITALQCLVVIQCPRNISCRFDVILMRNVAPKCSRAK